MEVQEVGIQVGPEDFCSWCKNWRSECNHSAMRRGEENSAQRQNYQYQRAPLDDEDDGYFSFKRKRNCQYLRPKLDDYDSDDCGLDTFEESPHKFLRLDDLEVEKEMNAAQANKLKYSLASLSMPKFRFIGFARRRMGRGGRVILDRASIRDSMVTAGTNTDELLSAD